MCISLSGATLTDPSKSHCLHLILRKQLHFLFALSDKLGDVSYKAVSLADHVHKGYKLSILSSAFWDREIKGLHGLDEQHTITDFLTLPVMKLLAA